jgi:hypothetical protein
MSVDRSRSGKSPDGARARKTIEALGDSIRAAATEVVWRQWSALGGMTSARTRATSLVDPEALVLMSLTLEADEPRLGDVLVDWALRNSELLSVQRMGNLADRYPKLTRARLHGFARIAWNEGKDHRWKKLAGGEAVDLTRRGNKPRAVRALAIEPAALIVRLRLAFGIGIKADLLAYLLGTEHEAWADVSAITAATGYTVAAVRKAARDLTEARFIETMAGARAEYRAPRDGWRALLGVTHMPVWRNWNEPFAFVAALLDWATASAGRPLTPYVLESTGRDLLEAHPAAFRWQGASYARWDESASDESSAISRAAAALSEWMIRNV